MIAILLHGFEELLHQDEAFVADRELHFVGFDGLDGDDLLEHIDPLDGLIVFAVTHDRAVQRIVDLHAVGELLEEVTQVSEVLILRVLIFWILFSGAPADVGFSLSAVPGLSLQLINMILHLLM